VVRLLGVTGNVVLTRIGLVPGGAIRHRRDRRSREVRKSRALTRPRVSRPALACGAQLDGLETFPWFGGITATQFAALASFVTPIDNENPSLG
jgi:hypothetical protein